MTQFAHASGFSTNKFPNKSQDDFSWRDLLTELFPDKTTASAASFTRTSVGALEHVMRGRNGLSARALVNLLRSPAGPRVLDAIAGDAAWRAVERRLLDIAELEKQLDQLDQKRRHLLERSSR